MCDMLHRRGRYSSHYRTITHYHIRRALPSRIDVLTLALVLTKRFNSTGITRETARLDRISATSSSDRKRQSSSPGQAMRGLLSSTTSL